MTRACSALWGVLFPSDRGVGEFSEAEARGAVVGGVVVGGCGSQVRGDFR
jgi:hypothetical protein